MPNEPARFRPKAFPPPEFPPRRVPLFARTPPAIFPVLLGLIGLALALRAGLARLGFPSAPGDAVAGVVAGLWALGTIAYLAKLARRPGVIWDDMKVLPARAGIAAASVGGMGVAGLLAPFAPGVAIGLLYAMLAAHVLVALVVLAVLARLPAEGRAANPGWHISFVGFIVGGQAAAVLGLEGLARGLLWATVPVAALIWAISLAQLVRRVPPAPLRPMLAIHLAPASLFATVAALTGQTGLAAGFGVLAVAIFVALLLAGRWMTEAGFSPLWGAFTFPLAAFSGAMIRLDGLWASFGIGLLAVALVAVPVITFRVLKMWATGALAAKTGAAEA